MEVVVNNGPPSLGAITAPLHPVSLNTPVNVSAPFTDPGVLDSHTGTWTWGDGSSSAATVSETNGSGTVSGSYSYGTVGIYVVRLSLADDDRGTVAGEFRRL